MESLYRHPSPVNPADALVALALVGPSGSGKSTLCRHLLETTALAQKPIELSRSFTTRAPRGAERDGVEYHFVSKERFRAMIDAGGFLEWAEVHGNYYGTPAAVIDDARARGACGVLFDIDYQGARQIRARVPTLVSVMIVPPSWQVLEARLRGRNTDSDEVIERRMANARAELAHYAMFDYLLLNDDLDGARREIEAIFVAERARRARRAGLAEALLRERR
ncbi:MAG: guanylate kinase [Myxococcales bacterium]|nr:guanylate kinase [Myxococcales bacterium]